MELHGAPGSQNGEMHSGIDLGEHKPGLHGKPEHYFDTDWNKQIACNAIEAMAKRGSEAGDTFYGIGILNEP